MSFLLSIIPTILVLGILIIIHEFGHFIACRLMKVKVEKFSIGFGPEIVHWQGKETRFAISLLPLGGFVKPAGESVTECEEGGPKEGDYLAAPLLARIFIVVAGVLMNYLLAFVLFAAVFMVGRPVPGTTIGGFVDGYPAQESGLQKTDKVLEVNGIAVETWGQLTEVLSTTEGDNFNLTIQRIDDRGKLSRIPMTIAPKVEEVQDIFGETHTLKRLGITPHPEANHFEKFGPLESIKNAWITELNMTVLTHKAIFYLITGKMSMKSMAGPIGIIAITGDAAKMGFIYVLQLTATLSVSLAVINLLPIPALDGGHLLFLLIEGIRRKSVSLEFQERASQVGFVLLMVLMVFIIYNDLSNLDVFDRIKNVFSGGTT